jgi:SAM-dependent methyltransferase
MSTSIVHSELGRETEFYDLIRDEGPVAWRIREKPVLSALDLGCAIPVALFTLCLVHGVKDTLGYDYRTAREILENDIEQPIPIEDSTMAKQLARLTGRSIVEAQAFMDGRLAYDGRFPISPVRFNTNIVNLKGKRGGQSDQFDLVLASNMLHYMPQRDVEQSLEVIAEQTKPDGLIYIRIKTAFEGALMKGSELVKLCNSFAERTGLAQYKGVTDHEGEHYTWTNL